MSKIKNNKTVGILSLGCPRNLVDSELLLSRLNLKNYKLVEIKDARYVIVNTCGFIKEAKQESLEAILDLIELKKQGRIKKIIAYGCLVERYSTELASSFKEIDAFVGRISLNHAKRNIYLTPKHYAYLKICEGCKNSCSFCVIPKIRGKFSSRSPESLIKEAIALEGRGAKEINIIGQDITLYGDDLKPQVNLTKLLKELIKKTKIRWIRLLYLYPSHIDDRLLELIANEERICKYIDLPLQHISERILKLMNRDTKKADLINLIRRIRKMIPEVALRTALMVGFPSETDREFNELINFIEEAKFERLGAFVYSREEGTPAYRIEPQVAERIKVKRFAELMSKQQEVSKKVNQRFKDKIMELIVDQCQQGSYIGRTQYDAPEVDGEVFIKTKSSLKEGQLIKVKIVDSLEYDLVGVPV